MRRCTWRSSPSPPSSVATARSSAGREARVPAGVIREIEIRDLVVIERAHIEPGAGLTAITGETGAGKTVVAQALGLLAGGQADSRAVRPGAKHALVQATVAVPDGFWESLDPDDPAQQVRELADDDGEVVVARRVPAEGRARALVDGQVASREGVAAFVGALMRFSGQHEQRRLVGPGAQMAILDAFAGAEAVALEARLRGMRRDLARLDRQVDEARERRERAEREREALEALVADVDEVAPDVAEEESLLSERSRLAHAERLASAAATAIALLDGDGEGGALTAAGQAMRSIEQATELDPTLRDVLNDLSAGEAALQEALIGVRRYADDLGAEPGRLDWVEDRLARYEDLSRRYGPGTDAVLARAGDARGALDALATGEAGDDAIAAQRDALLGQAIAAAGELRAVREDAAPRLAEAVEAALQDLAMAGATLRVEVVTDDDEVPRDRVSLVMRANPGLPEAPLADAASGGELSRVLLALHAVAAAADPGVAWVFDEVDAGIGGVTAAVVGERLAEMAMGRQVLVITHLPQVAAAADRHYRLVKGASDDGRAITTIESVEGDDLVDEICRMLGSAADDAAARGHARELLARRG
ncbi:MAG: DNA repair protein RecN [Actinobacteria bacterium]|nr:DNA repair protein RecN [Actinomycetota bacterium]